MDMKGYPETSVTNYQSTLRDVTEEQQSHLHRSRRKPQITHLHTCLCVHSIIQILNPKLGYTSRGQLKCDGTRAETRFRLLAKRTSPFKSAGASVQATTGSRGVRISGSNAGYTMFRGSVKSNGYPLHSPVSPSLPLPCVTVCHHISTEVYQKLFFDYFLRN